MSGHCQSRLEGFEGTGLDYAGVKLVPGDYGSWKKRLFVLFGVIAWNFKAAVMVSGLDFGQCSLGGLEGGCFGWLSGGLEIFQGGLLEPAPQPPCRGRSAAGLHAVLAE